MGANVELNRYDLCRCRCYVLTFISLKFNLHALLLVASPVVVNDLKGANDGKMNINVLHLHHEAYRERQSIIGGGVFQSSDYVMLNIYQLKKFCKGFPTDADSEFGSGSEFPLKTIEFCYALWPKLSTKFLQVFFGSF